LILLRHCENIDIIAIIIDTPLLAISHIYIIHISFSPLTFSIFFDAFIDFSDISYFLSAFHCRHSRRRHIAASAGFQASQLSPPYFRFSFRAFKILFSARAFEIFVFSHGCISIIDYIFAIEITLSPDRPLIAADITVSQLMPLSPRHFRWPASRFSRGQIAIAGIDRTLASREGQMIISLKNSRQLLPHRFQPADNTPVSRWLIARHYACAAPPLAIISSQHDIDEMRFRDGH
jgi:hypothetical protein